jgi:di/tricarboxylate transporter
VGQAFVFAVLLAALALFVWGRWRYDLVALAALLSLVVPGIVDAGSAFLGFGHPAVITVAAVLVVSRGLERSGFVERVAEWTSGVGQRPLVHLSLLTVLVAVASAFMNNVGALALFMPVAIRVARDHDRPASLFLMPLAFGSLLGGLMTLIGTPPNIIIATFRAEATGTAFTMFDFAPVGSALALVGVVFIGLLGWRLLPERKGQARPEELFELESYLSEVRIPGGSGWIGRALEDIVPQLDVDVTVIGIVRGDREIPPPFRAEPLGAGDVLLVEVEPGHLDALVSGSDLEAVGTVELRDRFLSSDQEMRVMEVVVRPESFLSGRTAQELQLRASHGLNLLGVARHGRRVRGRLSEIAFQPGDVLLLQGAADAVLGTIAALGGLPLAERGVEIGRPRRLVVAVGILGAAIAITAAGLLPVQVALTAAAVAFVVTGTVSLRSAYDSVQWPIIVLLAAMLPVGEALESTGGASTLADVVLRTAGPDRPELSLGLLLVATMLLSNVINNAAAAVLMAPIGMAVAAELGTSVDPFLMGVAVGASCAFLTPIGHQSNTLVMGPGGYRFGDYVYLGLPLSALVALLSLPLILWVWPL